MGYYVVWRAHLSAYITLYLLYSIIRGQHGKYLIDDGVQLSELSQSRYLSLFSWISCPSSTSLGGKRPHA
jgi:hypothetical protein